MDTLFEAFGYAKPTAEKKAKPAAPEASAAPVADSAPEASAAPEAKPAPDNAGKVGNVADFVAITRAVMANWSEAERIAYAQAMLPELLAMARTVPALTA
jgi:hypothetical protein